MIATLPPNIVTQLPPSLPLDDFADFVFADRNFCRALRSDRRQRLRGSGLTCRRTGPRDRRTVFLTGL